MISFHVLVVLIKHKKKENVKYVLDMDTLWVHIRWSSSRKISYKRKLLIWENNNNKSNKTVRLATTVLMGTTSTATHQSNAPYHLLSPPHPLQTTLTRHWRIATFSTREAKVNKIRLLFIKVFIVMCVILDLSRGIDIIAKYVKTLISVQNVITRPSISMIFVFLNNLKSNRDNSEHRLLDWMIDSKISESHSEKWNDHSKKINNISKISMYKVFS